MVETRRQILTALSPNDTTLSARELCDRLKARIGAPTLRAMYHDGLLVCHEGRPERWSLSEGGRAVLRVLDERDTV